MSAPIVLLCEDARTDIFVRRFLWHRKFRGRDVFTLPLPAGSASGEAWVRKRFPKQLRAIRHRQRAVLLVVTDADTNTTSERRSHLDQQCDRCNVVRSQRHDPVIVVVPRRNIESWLHHLKTSQAVAETHAYKPRYRSLSTCIRKYRDV